MFSQNMRRKGIVIAPADGMIFNPVKGEVIQIFHTMHAVGIKAEKEAEPLFTLVWKPSVWKKRHKV
ncbi:PTS system, glucose-specific IIA component [Halobacillus alkaliphilus]|uniref:PTS system, glucose-specific IIA component n=1 Tax=Halobacillus alkaliphilus TaxID=396056 RepID=A0A1I2LT21_9BACI|nr:PTS glucose transporter subunit IIA [Halobacillus alkaliphilus]SFF82395.1 PTS system, glucose-specific IIA component [Halobacillus alkaliphilus]